MPVTITGDGRVFGLASARIPTFASAAARDLALDAPSHGDLAFLTDTDTLTYFTGSAWRSYDLQVVANAPTGLLSVDVFTSQDGDPQSTSTAGGSAVWTRPQGCSKALVYVTGGGGGGRINDNSYRNAGGGGGATAIALPDVRDVEQVPVTWGAGGPFARNSGWGGTGGTSSFGTFCTATGGGGGQTDVPYMGGIGGTASGGDVNIPGGGGEMSHSSNREGGGGSSFWHKAGSHHHAQNQLPQVTHGQWGSGGSSGYYSQNQFAFDNANGGAGCVIVYSYA